MNKAVTIIAEDPEMQSILQKMDALETFYDDSKKFIEKQHKDLTESCQEKQDRFVKEIEALLRSQGKLPPEYTDEWCIHVNKENGVVTICNDQHDDSNPIVEILNLMGVKPKKK